MSYSLTVARTAKPYRLASRITSDCRGLIDALIARYGLSESGVVELAIREYAEKRNVQPVRVEPPQATAQPRDDAS